MSILIVHNEGEYFGGAEKMLIYFAEELDVRKVPVSIALVRGSKLDQELPPNSSKIYISGRDKFSIREIRRQSATIEPLQSKQCFRVVHGWAAKDWELASFLARRLRIPAVGTLHDHPASGYLSRFRRFLMRWTANHGLKKTVCVSKAVMLECRKQGYRGDRLGYIHNGVRFPDKPVARGFKLPLRLGFLGTFSPGKGVDGLFHIMEKLGPQAGSISVQIAGGTNCVGDEEWLADLKKRLETKLKSENIQWLGWINDLDRFFGGIDLLFFPSRMFDSFPTVLLEASRHGVPVLAADIGGASEIVVNGKTGWLFSPENWAQASERLKLIVADPRILEEMSRLTFERGSEFFSLNKMVDNYLELYSRLELHV